MRRLLFTLAIPLLLIQACGETTKEEIADVLIISQDKVAFPKEGGSATISVACPSDWQSSVPDQSWVTTTDGDGIVTITASANETGDSRKATVTLESTTSRKEIEVSQSWSGSALSLAINGPESIELDSEGDSFTFSVETDDEWSVKADESWLEVSADGKVINVTASANSGDHRDGTVTVSATAGGQTETKSIKVSQISREENPYFQMLGEFGLYAERWYYGGNAIDVPGIGTYCTIEQKEYGKSFTIKNLFAEGTEIEATYDNDTKKMVLTLGSVCLTKSITSTQQTYYYYPVQLSFTENKFETGILYGTVGTASDGKNDNCQAILLSGFNESYGAFGLVVRVMPDNKMATISDVYYADGSTYLVRASKDIE